MLRMLVSFQLWFFSSSSVGDPSLRFKIITATRYTGPGEIKAIDNPLCTANFCVASCLAESTDCRVAALNKQKCQCYLYNDDFYSNSKENVTDFDWDLLTSYYYSGQ